MSRVETPDQLPPIPLRGHHLDIISKVVLYRKTLANNPIEIFSNGVTPENIYSQPHIGNEFVSELIDDEIEMLVSMFYAPYNHDDAEIIEDYLGSVLRGTLEYKQSMEGAVRQLFLSPPDQRVVVSARPDEFCLACQSTQPESPGLHCQLLDGSLDRRYIRALNSTLTVYLEEDRTILYDHADQIQISDGMTILPIGFLRNDQFQTIFDRKLNGDTRASS